MTAGDQERLYMEYYSRVLGYIRARVNNKEDAEDLCADVFEKAFRSYADYDKSKAAPGTWLYSITRNTVIDYYRRSRPTAELPEDIPEEESIEEGLINAQTLEDLAKAMEKLPSALTEIIVLRYYDRIPLTEISQRMGMSYGALKLKHQKALKMLRSAMKDSGLSVNF